MEVLLSAFEECWSQAAIDRLLFLKVKAYMEVLLSAFVEWWSQAAIDRLLFLKVKAYSKYNFILLKT